MADIPEALDVRQWEEMAEEAVRVSMLAIPEQKTRALIANALREKGVDEATIDALNMMFLGTAHAAAFNATQGLLVTLKNAGFLRTPTKPDGSTRFVQ